MFFGFVFFFFKQKTAYEMRISDWSSDVCSSDLVATAKARIREARASYRQAGGVLYPAVDGTTSATRRRSGSDTGGSEISSQFQAGFDASWELDLFGGNGRQVEAAGYGMEAAEQELRATLLTLVGDVASSYVEARGLQARIAYARQTAASQRETEALTRVRFEAGAAAEADVPTAPGQANNTIDRASCRERGC